MTRGSSNIPLGCCKHCKCVMRCYCSIMPHFCTSLRSFHLPVFKLVCIYRDGETRPGKTLQLFVLSLCWLISWLLLRMGIILPWFLHLAGYVWAAKPQCSFKATACICTAFITLTFNISLHKTLYSTCSPWWCGGAWLVFCVTFMNVILKIKWC